MAAILPVSFAPSHFINPKYLFLCVHFSLSSPLRPLPLTSQCVIKKIISFLAFLIVALDSFVSLLFKAVSPGVSQMPNLLCFTLLSLSLSLYISLSLYLSINQFSYLSVYIFTSPSLYVFFFRLSICFSVCKSVSMCLSDLPPLSFSLSSPLSFLPC